MKKLMLVLLAIAIPAVLLMGCAKKDDPVAAVMKNVSFQWSITGLDTGSALGGGTTILMATWTSATSAPTQVISQAAGSTTYSLQKTESLPQGTDLTIKLGGAGALLAGVHPSAKATVKILVEGVQKAQVVDVAISDIGSGVLGWNEAALTATCKAE